MRQILQDFSMEGKNIQLGCNFSSLTKWLYSTHQKYNHLYNKWLFSQKVGYFSHVGFSCFLGVHTAIAFCSMAPIAGSPILFCREIQHWL